ncbi:DUF6338 family protein [Methylocystis sp. 9N]|uniref:DUF6338 family protein n=1 Tax=Methylocystis borbori TaxID=3118750 RepID=A0ABU7XFZ4_9HYPH
MPDFKGLENFNLILFFIVPGIVIVSARSRFITGRMPSLTENVLGFFVLSLIYYSLTVLFIEQALSVREPWIAKAIIWIMLILCGPALFGIFLGVSSQKEWFSWIPQKCNVTTIHVIPTAWDWRFSKVPRGGQFVMVTLTNDEKVAGFFGSNSFASSDSGERDLYIEEEYIVSKADIWEPRADKVGILVAAKEIKYIEFWEPKVEENAHD